MHPLIPFCYFLSVLAFSMWLTHPLLLGISVLGAVSLSLALKLKTVKILPVFLLAALVNPLVSHEGVTVLFYLPGGNPCTLESLVYGGKVSLTLMASVGWCIPFHHVMTSEKIHCIFSRVSPTLGLVFSQTLALIPRLLRQGSAIFRVRTGGGKLRRAGESFSSLATWALEHAGETAESMKARGYGLSGRTSFTPYRFKARDGQMLFALFALAAGSLLAKQLPFRYFPSLKIGRDPYGVLGAVFFGVLCLIPTLWEVKGWKR